MIETPAIFLKITGKLVTETVVDSVKSNTEILRRKRTVYKSIVLM